MKIIMMGPQGSGKGTQAKRIGEKLGIPHISTGDLLREELSAGTDLGKALRGIMEAGRLVPDEIILHITARRLAREDCTNGFIADGFPRNLSQLLEIPSIWRVDHAIQLFVDTRTSIDRLAARINCPKCKATYGPKNPPAQPGICDRCGEILQQRTDDTAAASVIKRLELYWSEIPPVLEYFRSADKLTTLDGTQSIETIEAQIARIVGA